MRSCRLSRFAASLFLAAFGCGADGGGQPPPHIVLVVVDTLRADHLGVYGYGRPTSPNFDALAADATVYTDATAQSSWTRPSVASLFTSRLPSEHGAVAAGAPLDEGVATLAELLRDAGYRTVGVSANFVHVSPNSGLTRGFDRFWAEPIRDERAEQAPLYRLGDLPLRAPTASELNERVAELLPTAAGTPVFLYVHYMDPHSGYAAPDAYRRRFAGGSPPSTSDHVVGLAAGETVADEGERERLISLYDAEVAYTDAQLGALLALLDHRGFGDAFLIVTADHGEEFQEHGGWFHGLTLHRELLHVPLLMRHPGAAEGGTLRSDPVDLLDVATTLLAAAGVDPAPGMRGRDLFAPELSPRARIAQLHRDPTIEARTGRKRHRAAVAEGSFRILIGHDGDASVYQVDEDPGERSPLQPGSAGWPSAWVEQVVGALELAEPDSSPPGAVTPAERERLRALGYAE